MLNVMVTGGAGYKGILLVERLLQRGHTVTLLDNFLGGFAPILHLVAAPNLRVVSLDIRNLTANVVKNQDVVYHLAGISGMPACAANPNAAEAINVQGTAKLLSVLHKDQLLIYASTTSIYGATDAECDEDVRVHPPSIYAMTKYEAERMTQQRENSISLRFATVFGISPRMRNDLLVNDFTYKAVVDRAVVIFAGRSKRTFIHIDDAIAAYLFALDYSGVMRGRVYNVGHETLNFSKNDIAAAIRKRVSFEIISSSLPDLDVRDFLVSFRRIRDLGYMPKRTLDNGIADLLKLYAFYRVAPMYALI